MPTIVVTATVKSRADVLGQSVTTRFAPSLAFAMSSLELTVSTQSNANGSPTSSGLKQSKTGSVYQRVLKPATLAALGRSIRVSTARNLGAIGTSASLVVALGVVGWELRRRRQDEATQIKARYGPELVGVRTAPEDNRRIVIDVVGMPALAKVAETYGSAILDHAEDDTDTFYVDAGTAIYRYRPATRVPPEAEREPSRDQPERSEPSRQMGTARQAGAAVRPKPEDPEAGHATREREVISAFRRQLEEQAPEERAAALVREEEQSRERKARLLLEAEAFRSSAERGAQRLVEETERKALKMLEKAKATAERIRLESAREVAASRARRDAIDAEVADLRRAFEAFDSPAPELRSPPDLSGPVLDMAQRAFIPPPKEGGRRRHCSATPPPERRSPSVDRGDPG